MAQDHRAVLAAFAEECREKRKADMALLQAREEEGLEVFDTYIVNHNHGHKLLSSPPQNDPKEVI